MKGRGIHAVYPAQDEIRLGGNRLETGKGLKRSKQPGSLSDEEAQLIAAYINSQERPEYPDKAGDFPAGGRPADAVYDTLVFAKHPYRTGARN